MARYLFFILIPILFISCSEIFSTREPEDPQGNPDNYFSESVSELTSNFKTSLLGLDQYLYESLFYNNSSQGTSYSFISLASDVEQAVFEDWSIENEKLFISGLRTSSASLSDIILTSGSYDETGDSTSVDIRYSMKVTLPDGEFTVSGTFTFGLIRTDGLFWYIKTWTDISPSGNISFSSLKVPYAI